MANNRKEEKKKVPVPPALPRSESSPSLPNKGEVKKWFETGEWHSPKPTAVEQDAVRVTKPRAVDVPEFPKTSVKPGRPSYRSVPRPGRTIRPSGGGSAASEAAEGAEQITAKASKSAASKAGSSADDMARLAGRLKSASEQEIKQALQGSTKEAFKDVAMGSARKVGSTILGDVLGAFGGIALDPQATGGEMDSTGRYSDELQPHPERLKKNKDARPAIAKSAMTPKNKR